MATLDFNVNDLILDALGTIRLYSRFQDLRPDYMTNGLRLLHIEISKMNASGSYIPYQTTLDFPIINNQSEYTISKEAGADIDSEPFIEINYLDAYFNSIQYPIQIITDKNALMLFRSTNISTVPNAARVHQSVDGLTTTIIFFNPPNQDYDGKIRGKRIVGYPGLQDNITDLPKFAYEFFMLRIAKRLANFYGKTWSQDLQLDLTNAENLVLQSADWDLWVRAPGALTRRNQYLWLPCLGVRT